MRLKRGFTLIEIIVVLFIVGIVAALVIPNLVTASEQTRAQGAKNNLLAISAAQSKFNEDYSPNYCISTGANPTGYTVACGDTVADLNTNLHLSISDSFTYTCTNASAPYICTATDGTVTLTTSGTGVNCTAGGSSCPS